MFLTWTAVVIGEAFRGEGLAAMPLGLYYQALALVFAGYAVGWKEDLMGTFLVGVGLQAS